MQNPSAMQGRSSIRSEESKISSSVKYRIISTGCEIIAMVLIVVYAVLSPSLFSSIGVLFLMAALFAMITRIYYIPERQFNQNPQLRPKQLVVRSQPITRMVWILFTLANLVMLVFKVVVLATGTQNQYTRSEQQFYEIQSLFYMFVPAVILPFSFGAMFSQPHKTTLEHFQKQIPSQLRTPSYLLLTLIIVGIQILSVSFVGIAYFFIVVGLFFVQNIGFDNLLYRSLVCMVQLINLTVIPTSLLAITDEFRSFEWSQYYPQIGIEGLSEFTTNLKSRGHFIFEILLFLYCCLLQRLFTYQRMNNEAVERIGEQSISESELFQGQKRTQQEISDFSPSKLLRESLLKIARPRSTVQVPTRQFQLTESHRGLKVLDNQEDKNYSSLIQKTVQFSKEQAIKNENQHQKAASERSRHSSFHSHSNSHYTASTVNKNKSHSPKSESFLSRLWNSFLRAINSVAQFLNSPEFTLRIVELFSIVVIQRYNNVYSFMALLWLAMVASVENLKVVFYATALVLVPLELVNYVILFLFNIPNSFISYMSPYYIWGFEAMETPWLDVIIFNVYLYYIICFVFAAKKKTRTSTYQKSKVPAEPTNGVLAVAFLFRYTYLLTIGAMFLMGFSNVTAIDLCYVVLFFIFFTFGESVQIEKKKRRKKAQHQGGKEEYETKLVLTTFSRRYWFVIVYFTLACIVTKYTFFLFFYDGYNAYLDPLGVIEVIEWPFNFSLSSICKSSTTPFFIIFVLAELQIMVHRSSIYLNYSFSLMSAEETRSLKSEKNQKVTASQTLSKLGKKTVLFCLQFYYQGLYYFGGIIILGCTYRWNIIQIPIVVLTCYGLLNRFNKKILGAIVLIDLIYIFTNYLFRFVNYRAVRWMFGNEFTGIWKDIGMFCGFILDGEISLQYVFALNVVIFYFSVESYRLCKLLSEDKFKECEEEEQHQKWREKVNNPTRSILSIKSKKSEEDRPFYASDPTVIDSEYDDNQFAEQYQKGVVETTKRYYNTNMIKKYGWLRMLCKILAVTIVDIVAIVVLVSCLYFRLSVSMFFFLVVYLTFYYLLFDSIGLRMIKEKYSETVESVLEWYNRSEGYLQERENPQRFYYDREKMGRFQKYVDRIYLEILDQKCEWKRKIWIYSAVLSVTCLVLTYGAQFLIAEFYTTYIHLSVTPQIENFLFIAGFSVTNQTTFFRQVYFYYFMVAINVLEKLLIRFMSIDEELKNTYDIKKDFKAINKLENPSYFVDKHLYTEDFVQKVEVHETLRNLEDDEIDSEDSAELDEDDNSAQLAATANILIYFNFKEVQIKVNIFYAALSVMVRTYLWLMLLNVYSKSNVAAFLYIAAVVLFWFKKIDITAVKNINKAAILILAFQYILLLLDIDPITSPLPLPNGTNLSLFENYITDDQWMDFIVISKDSDYTGVIFVAFLINSIVIFITEVYFAGIQWITKLCIALIEKVWDRYDYIFRTISGMDQHQKLDLNYENYKSLTYRAFTFIYETFIMNSYLFVAIIILLLLSGDHTYIALTMLIFSFAYIYLSIFTSYGTDENIFKYTEFYFSTFRIILFALLLIGLVLDIPPIYNFMDGLNSIIGLDIGLSEVFLLLFLELWLDLTKSSEFYRVTVTNLANMRKRENVRLNCLAYQTNNQRLRALIDTYNYILTFDANIEEAKLIIKNWDENFKVEEDLDSEEKEADLLSLEESDVNPTKKDDANQRAGSIADAKVDISKSSFSLNPSVRETQSPTKKRPPFQLESGHMSSVHLEKLKEIKKREIAKQEASGEEEKSVVSQLIEFMERHTNHSLSYSYFEMMQYIVRNNQNVLKKVLNHSKISIDIWDYVLEDYTKLEEQIIKSSDELTQVGRRVAEEDPEFRLELIKIIREEEYESKEGFQSSSSFMVDENVDGYSEKSEKQEDTPKQQRQEGQQKTQKALGVQEKQELLYKVTTPKKINLVIKQSQKSLQKAFWYWGLSVFSYFLIFMIWVYYCLNPSLLSLPLIVYLFCYDSIADKKYHNLMLLYIFFVIILAQMFQLQLFENSQWTKYLFYLPGNTNSALIVNDEYHFEIGFLFYIFVLIFVNEEIKKYQGIKYRHESEAENLEASALRVLINEEEDSQMYLWKMLVENEMDYEKMCNPLLYLAEKIEENPEKMYQKSKPSLRESFYRNKVGVDLYPYIATVQIFLLIYLIFLYPLMTLTNKSALEQSFKYFSFSANMILAILSHILVICVERKIALLSSENRHKELIKYAFTMAVFVLFALFIYYWASYRAPSSYQPQGALVAFAFFYFVYFLLSGLQIKYGYKKFKRVNSFMVTRKMPNYLFLMVFIAIPFLYEIKCIMDWTYLKTSIQLFDWFKLFSIYVASFKAKIQYDGSTGSELGDPLAWTVKLMGWAGFTILLLIIFGPMILFSGLNPSSVQNIVTGGSLEISIEVAGGNTFKLYSTSHFSTPPISFNGSYFDQVGLDQVPLFQGLTESDMQRQLQQITFETYSDEYWGISLPNFNFLKQSFNQTASDLAQNLTPTYQYRIRFEYYLEREVEEVTGSVTEFDYPPNNGVLNEALVKQLNASLHECNTTTTIPNLYNSLIRLTTTGTTYKPSVIDYQNQDNEEPFMQNVTMKMICSVDATDPNSTIPIDTNNIYWEIDLANSTNGVEMFVFSDLYQSLLGGLSFTALYTSIILVVAGFVRGLLAGDLTQIPYLMNPKPDKILHICQAIGTLRDRKQYKDEFLMYYELIDVIRSPQVIRKLGASYAKQIEREYKIRKLKEKSKQERQKKKNL